MPLFLFPPALVASEAPANAPSPPAHWNWNGSTPSGTVAEKKESGDVSIQSHRGNTIKKSAQPNDPAIHLSRPGNDVVKNQSDLIVDKKGADDKAGEKPEDKKEEKKEETTTNGSNKRKAEDEPTEDGEKAEPSAKKTKAGRPNAALNEKAEPKAKNTPKKETAPKEDGEKKSRGRPKGQGAGAKKEKKPPAPPTGVGKRTRSQK